MFSPCLSVLGTYFRRKRAFVVGIAASGTAVGAVAFPIMLEHLFVQVGFKLAILYLAILQLVILCIANLITRPRKVLASTSPVPRPPLVPVLLKIARQPSAWLVCLGTFGVMICLFIPLFYVVAYARDVAKNELLADYAVRFPSLSTQTRQQADEFITDAARNHQRNRFLRSYRCWPRR